MEWLTAIEKLVPILQQYPPWVKIATSGWLVCSAALLCVLVFVPRVRPDEHARTAPAAGCDPVVRTGDEVIDRVTAKLCELRANPTGIPESDVGSRDDFTQHLPQVVIEPDYNFFDARDATIRQIRAILKPLGMTNW